MSAAQQMTACVLCVSIKRAEKVGQRRGLAAKHCGVCQRTGMVTKDLFPILAPVLANITQIFISLVTLRLGIALLPDVRIFARRDQDFSLGGILVQAVVHLALIITAIGGKNGQLDDRSIPATTRPSSS